MKLKSYIWLMVTHEILFWGEKVGKTTQAARNTWSESHSITRKRICRRLGTLDAVT